MNSLCKKEINLGKVVDYITILLYQMKKNPNNEQKEESKSIKSPSLQLLMKKYQNKKIKHKENTKRNIIFKDKRIKDEEERQKKCLSLIRQAEAERRAKELRRVKKIALSYVNKYII